MFNKFTSRSKKTSSVSSKLIISNEDSPNSSSITEPTPQPGSKPSGSLDNQEQESRIDQRSHDDHNSLLVITPQNELNSPSASFFNLNSNTPKSLKTLNINPNFNSSKTSISSKSGIGIGNSTPTGIRSSSSSSSNHQTAVQEEPKPSHQNHHQHTHSLQQLIQDSIDQDSIESTSNQSIENTTTPTINNSSQAPPSRNSPSTTLLAPLPLSSTSTTATPTHSPISSNHQINPRKPNKKASKSSSITSTNSVIATGGIAEALAMSGVALLTQANHVPSPPSISRTSNPTSTHQSNGNLNDPQLLNINSSTSNGFRSPTSVLHQHGSNYDLASEFDDQFLGTGYAVASRKRNFDFHSIFKAIPQDDYLIEDYGCALQRDILVQGRLYISEQHLCFNANIFGWVTTLVLPFSDVVSIEKKMTALIIPNAIQVMTMQSRHTFASFISRDVTYDLMNNIWRISHPTIPTHNNSSTISLNPAIGNDEVHVEYLGPSTTDPNSTTNSNPNETTNTNPNTTTTMTKLPESTVCACLGTDAHYKDVALDTTYKTSVENLYNLLFLNSEFMISFWENDQRLTELETSEWTNKTKKISYIKPLNASMGPKQCKCELNLQIIELDFLNSITVLTTTRTPDVPAGSSFSVLTRTCLMFVPDGVRIVVTTSVEWSKVNRFLKGIIESSALSGQKAYHVDLDVAIREELKRQENDQVQRNGGNSDENQRKESDQRNGSLNEKKLNPIRNQNESIKPNQKVDSNLTFNSSNQQQQHQAFYKVMNLKSFSITTYLGISIIMILLISNLLSFRNHQSIGINHGNQERIVSRDEIRKAIRDGIDDWVLNLKRKESDEIREIEVVLDRFEERIKVLRGVLLGHRKDFGKADLDEQSDGDVDEFKVEGEFNVEGNRIRNEVLDDHLDEKLKEKEKNVIGK